MTAKKSVGLVASKHLVQRSQGFAVAEFAIVLPVVVFVAAMVLVVDYLMTFPIKPATNGITASKMNAGRKQMPSGNTLFTATDFIRLSFSIS